MYGRVFFVALGLVGALGAAAIYGIGAFLVVDGNISPGTLVALAALVTRVYSPLTGLTNARVDLMTSMVSFERVFEVLDAPEGVADRPGAVDLVDPKGMIEFDSVTFRYPTAGEVTVPSLEAPNALLGHDPDRDVLTGLDLTLQPGETVALVGASGAGKTTLASLIPRLYDVTGGAHHGRRHDVRDLTQEIAACRDRRRHPGPAPVPRVDRRQPALRQARRHDAGARRGVPRGAHLRHDRVRCPTATTRSSASAATGSVVARSSGWRSPGCC